MGRRKSWNTGHLEKILQGRICNDKKGESWPKRTKPESDSCSVNAPEESLTLSCTKRLKIWGQKEILSLGRPKDLEEFLETLKWKQQ